MNIVHRKMEFELVDVWFSATVGRFFHSWTLTDEWVVRECNFISIHIPGDMENEMDVLEWMVGQKTDESIELISRETLFTYINTQDFLAVIFCKFRFVVNKAVLMMCPPILCVPNSRRRGSTKSAGFASRWADRRRGVRVRHQNRQVQRSADGEKIRLPKAARHHILPQGQVHQLWRRYRRRGRAARLVDAAGQHGNDRSHWMRQSQNVAENPSDIRLSGGVFLYVLGTCSAAVRTNNYQFELDR